MCLFALRFFFPNWPYQRYKVAELAGVKARSAALEYPSSSSAFLSKNGWSWGVLPGPRRGSSFASWDADQRTGENYHSLEFSEDSMRAISNASLKFHDLMVVLLQIEVTVHCKIAR